MNYVDRFRIPRHAMWLGVFLGAGFGLWNLVATMLDPLAEDTPRALLVFYGPMFTIWGATGFVVFRRTRQIIDAVKVVAFVAFVTFVVFDITVLVRVNLFLRDVSQRSDWQNVMARFRTSGFESLRSYVNYLNVIGAPFKILVASIIGALTGLIGGLLAAATTRRAA